MEYTSKKKKIDTLEEEEKDSVATLVGLSTPTKPKVSRPTQQII